MGRLLFNADNHWITTSVILREFHYKWTYLSSVENHFVCAQFHHRWIHFRTSYFLHESLPFCQLLTENRLSGSTRWLFLLLLFPTVLFFFNARSNFYECNLFGWFTLPEIDTIHFRTLVAFCSQNMQILIGTNMFRSTTLHFQNITIAANHAIPIETSIISKKMT